MSMTPIPPDVLDAAMTRLRAGEKFAAVRESMHIGGDRLGHQLRTTYPDYTTLMQENQARSRESSRASVMSQHPPTAPTVAKEIPPEVLEIAITRLRAGDMFSVVRDSLHISSDRLRSALRKRYVDFDAIMLAHKRHDQPKPKPQPPEAVPERPKPLAPKRSNRAQYPGFVDMHAKVLERREQAYLAAGGGEPPRGYMRGIAEFSEQELAALKVKLQMWVRAGMGRPVLTLHNWIGEA